ncbi:alpha/beta hydrolase [Undibacterium arcticum]|uniref:Alpha/beta hydrolase n=1 Tax=Undibacterium arcticum TaxID=1762892 RepID=A0ABV7EUX9_9BURK
MAIDPQAQGILAMFAGFPEPDYSTLDVTAYRAIDAQRSVPSLNEAVSHIADHVITAPAGPMTLRLYHPAPGSVLPAIVFFHGGGWVSCGLDTHDNLCRRLANLSGCAVISVDYRLAPEAAFPGPVDDGCAALRWIHGKASTFGINPGRLAVAGDSAGGNLAAACAQLSLDPTLELPKLSHQLLFYPVIDAACDTPSFDTYATGYLLTNNLMKWFWQQYLRVPADAEDPRACPLRATSFSGLASATIITAEYDPLRDEGEAYAARLRQDGVPVQLKCWDGVFHGFASMVGIMQAADDALALGAKAVGLALTE